jgi:hypothetical protein
MIRRGGQTGGADMSDLPRYTVTYRSYPFGIPKTVLVAAATAQDAQNVACAVRGIDIADIISTEVQS